VDTWISTSTWCKHDGWALRNTASQTQGEVVILLYTNNNEDLQLGRGLDIAGPSRHNRFSWLISCVVIYGYQKYLCNSYIILHFGHIWQTGLRSHAWVATTHAFLLLCASLGFLSFRLGWWTVKAKEIAKYLELSTIRILQFFGSFIFKSLNFEQISACYWEKYTFVFMWIRKNFSI